MFSSKIVDVSNALAGIRSGAFAATGTGGNSGGMTAEIYDSLTVGESYEFELEAVQSARLGTWIDDNDSSRSALLPSFQCTVKQGARTFSTYLDFGTVYSLAKGDGKATLQITSPAPKDGKPVIYKRGGLANKVVKNIGTNVSMERDQVMSAVDIIGAWYMTKIPA